MSEDGEADRRLPSRDPLLTAALAGAANSSHYDDLISRQIRLADLQIDSLEKQDEYELSHLRWRRFNDQMKGALQIMVVAIGLLIVVGIGVALWNASRAEGLVVDTFSVPPAFAQSGTSGEVVADDMTGKIATIRDFANDNSLAHSNDVSEDRAREVKVEIPETGISLAEAWRYLRQWLGHERHLSGNLRSLPDGRIALTASLGGADTFTVAGAAADLDKLEQRAAERVFATTDRINYVLYLNGKHRNADALSAAARNVALSQSSNKDLGEAYALYANMIRPVTGDLVRSMALARRGLAIDPTGAPQHMEFLNGSRSLGHDEDILRQGREIANLRIEDNVGAWRSPSSTGFAYVQQLGAFYRAAETGNFGDILRQPCTQAYQCSPSDADLRRATAAGQLHDAAQARKLIAQAIADGGVDNLSLARARYHLDAAESDWKSAISDARAMFNALMTLPDYAVQYRATVARTQALPVLARALAQTGDFSAARRAIDRTQADCYNCLRARGTIDAAAKDWDGAAYWFARAVKAAPSVPFAYSDWGAMLLRKGDFDGAIAKFEVANQKGPHFADALEMWGEALIAKNRSDLALAKFDEANKYAPNWGRLRLKWGEALLWSGDRTGAQKQFAIATHLDLTQSEKSELAKMWGAHG